MDPSPSLGECPREPIDSQHWLRQQANTWANVDSDPLTRSHYWATKMLKRHIWWKDAFLVIIFAFTKQCSSNVLTQIHSNNCEIMLHYSDVFSNEHDGVSNHQPHGCLLNLLFRRRSKKTSKFCFTGLCAGNSPVTGEFPTQRASNVENVSIWWCHHGLSRSTTLVPDSGNHQNENSILRVISHKMHWGWHILHNLVDKTNLDEAMVLCPHVITRSNVY